MTPWSVLIVDAHAATPGELVREFEDAGASVVTAQTASAAIALAIEHAPEVAIVSNELKEESGFAVLEHLRREAAGCSVLMLSEIDDVSARLEALAGGCDDYLRLPVRPAEIVARASRHLALRRELRAARDEVRRLLELANLDELTQLSNLGAFQVRLSGEFARAQRYDDSLSLLLIQFDSLQTVAENFGEQLKEQALLAVARSFKVVFRTTDFVARADSHQFAALLPKTHLGGALSLAERLDELVTRIQPGPPGLSLKATIGVAAFPGRGVSTAEQLWSAAGQALEQVVARPNTAIGIFSISG